MRPTVFLGRRERVGFVFGCRTLSSRLGSRGSGSGGDKRKVECVIALVVIFLVSIVLDALSMILTGKHLYDDSKF